MALDHLEGLGGDIRRAKRIHAILNRADIDRWEKRSKTQLRFIVLSFLIGGLLFASLFLIIGTVESIEAGKAINPQGVVRLVGSALIGGFTCGAPLVVLPCTVLVTGGVKRYRQFLESMKQQHRVCEACGVVALFEDEFVNASPEKGHTTRDLVPQMRVVEEAGMTHVLCEKCNATA